MNRIIRLALIGAGKTGGEVLQLAQKKDKIEIIGPFEKEDDPNEYRDLLEQSDIVLLLTPGNAIKNLLPVLLSLTKPVLMGSTGHTFSDTTLNILKERKLCWVMASNFSLGMLVVKSMIEAGMNISTQLLKKASYSIEEKHHIHKIDAPSGTALAWKRWLTVVDESMLNIPITSIREGDTVGEHHLYIETEYEEIEIRHRSKTRTLFAQGAIWAAEQLVLNPPTEFGVTLLEDWVSSFLLTQRNEI